MIAPLASPELPPRRVPVAFPQAGRRLPERGSRGPVGGPLRRGKSRSGDTSLVVIEWTGGTPADRSPVPLEGADGSPTGTLPPTLRMVERISRGHSRTCPQERREGVPSRRPGNLLDGTREGSPGGPTRHPKRPREESSTGVLPPPSPGTEERPTDVRRASLEGPIARSQGAPISLRKGSTSGPAGDPPVAVLRDRLQVHRRLGRLV